MEYELKHLEILDVQIVKGEQITDFWKKPMTGIKTPEGYLVDHLHNLEVWFSKIGQTIELTQATLRNSRRNDTHWGHIGKMKWMK